MSTIRREQLRSPLSASYALTASYAENAGASTNTSGLVTTSSFNAFTASINNFTSSYNTGSFSGSFTGSLNGTASWANNALTASSVIVTLSANTDERLPLILAYTGSTSGTKLMYVDSGLDYNTNTNALYLPTNGAIVIGNTTIQSSVATFGSNDAQNHIVTITGSLNVSKSVNVDGTVTAGFGTNSIGFVGTASWAQSASYTLSSSYALSSSYTLTASYVTPLHQDVIITGSIYIPDNNHSIYFSGSGAASRLVWNDVDGTLELGLKGGVVKSELGQGLVTRVVNKTSPLIDLASGSYQVVVVAGAQGQRLAVKLAQADNDANSAGTLGIVAEDIARNQEGFIITVGLLKNRDTTGALQGETWNDGDILYLSPTVAGQMTNIKPQAPQHTVIIGYVEYAHQNNGKIYVKIDNGYELDELHNVRITTASLTPGQLLVRSGSNNSGVWINSNQLTGSYGLTGSLQATSFTGSLLGTSSWANNSVSSSYALSSSFTITASFVRNAQTASYVNPLRQDVQITGSLFVSNSIDSSQRFLYDTTGNVAVDWENRTLNSSIKWDDSTFYPADDDSVDLGINPTNRFRYGYFARSVTAASFYGDLIGTASFASASILATSASSVFTKRQALSNAGYLVYVDSNNNSGDYENLYTIDSIQVSGSAIIATSFTGSLFGTASYALTASYAMNGGGGGSTNTGSLLTTASANLNTITFTKGDGSTFPITVDTGSGGTSGGTNLGLVYAVSLGYLMP